MCGAGYYKDGNDCVMCTGNTVQSTVGNGTSCPNICDGLTKVPNSGHRACGKNKKLQQLQILTTNYNCVPFVIRLSVEDPGSLNSLIWDKNILFDKMFVTNCMGMK